MFHSQIHRIHDGDENRHVKRCDKHDDIPIPIFQQKPLLLIFFKFEKKKRKKKLFQ